MRGRRALVVAALLAMAPDAFAAFDVGNINALPGATTGTNCTGTKNTVAAPGWEWNYDPGSGPGCIDTVLTSSPSLSGQAREMDLSWSCPAGAASCTRQWGGVIAHATINSSANGNLDTTDTSFSYSAWVYYTDLSHINALEFDLNQTLSNGDGTTDTIIYAAQCDFNDGVWDIGNHWAVKSNVPCTKAASPLAVLNTWHHVVLSYHVTGARTKGQAMVTYDSVAIDGTVYPFSANSINDAQTLNWSPDGGLLVNWQMDFNYTGSGQTKAYADHIEVASPENSSLGDPVLAIASPADGATLTGPVEISGTASLSGGAVSSVEVSLDGGAWQPALGTSSWAYYFNAANGAHTVTARAAYSTGATQSASVTIDIDQPQPAQGAISPLLFTPVQPTELASAGAPFDAFGKQDGLNWHNQESSTGVYNWSAMDAWVNAGVAAGKPLVYSLGQMPCWAASSISQVHGDRTTGFCSGPPGNESYWTDYLTAMVTRYKGKIKYYELGNEINTSTNWVMPGSSTDTASYAGVVSYMRDAYETIHSIDPNALVIAPDVVAIDSQDNGKSYTSYWTEGSLWMKNYLKAGGYLYADVGSWHAYPPANMENAGAIQLPLCGSSAIFDCSSYALLDQINTMRATYDQNGMAGKPIVTTEGGWYYNAWVPDLEEQAAYLARWYLLQASSGVAAAEWYQWSNVNGPGVPGDQFGTLFLANSNGILPGGVAYWQVRDWLSGAAFSKQCSADATHSWSCGLTRQTPSGYQALVVWNSSGTYDYPITAGRYVQYRDLQGGVHALSGSATSIAVSSQPVILENMTGPVTPVVISNVKAQVYQSSATITWTTNQASDSQVQYGTATYYGSTIYYSLQAANSSAVTAHSVSVTGLSPNPSAYHYEVLSKTSEYLAAARDFTLNPGQVPPAITSALAISGPAGAPFSYRITASNGPTSFGASGLPAGLSVDPTSGLISGTPTVAGTTDVTLSATNSAGTGSAALVLTVQSSAPPAKTVPGELFAMDFNTVPSPFPALNTKMIRLWDSGTRWDQIEGAAQGQYDWSKLDSWLATAQANGQTVLYTFGGVPSWASSNPSLSTCSEGNGNCAPPSDLNADGSGTDQMFKDFVAALVAHVGPKIQYYEIWNEVNAQSFWQGTAQQLVRMAQDARAIIKAAQPNALVLTACTTASPNSAFTNGEYKTVNPQDSMDYYLGTSVNGVTGAQLADGVDIHTYPSSAAPDGMLDYINGTFAAMSKHGVASLPLWISESSWGQNPSIPGCSSTGPFSAACQANMSAWLAQSYALTAGAGVQRYVWYAYANSLWGTLDYKGAMLPAAKAYSQVAQWLTGATASSCSLSGSIWTCPVVRPDGSPALIVWNKSGASSYAPAGSYNHAWDVSGSTYAVGATVTIGNSPIFLYKAGTIPAPPVVTSALAASGTAGAAFSYQITASNSPTSFSASGLLAGLAINAASGLISGTPTAAGSFSVTISAANSAGAGSAVLSLIIAAPKDTTPPTVAIASPSGGATVSGTVSVSGTADDDVQVSSVAVSVDGGAYALAKGTASWTYTLNTSGLASSSHTITASAWDGSSNATTTSILLIVDNLPPPTVSLTAPAAGATVSNTVLLEASAASQAGNPQVLFQVDGQAVSPSIATGPYGFSWNSLSVPNGQHVLTAVAVDRFGFKTASAPVVVSVWNRRHRIRIMPLPVATPASATVTGSFLSGQAVFSIWIDTAGEPSFPALGPTLTLKATLPSGATVAAAFSSLDGQPAVYYVDMPLSSFGAQDLFGLDQAPLTFQVGSSTYGALGQADVIYPSMGGVAEDSAGTASVVVLPGAVNEQAVVEVATATLSSTEGTLLGQQGLRSLGSPSRISVSSGAIQSALISVPFDPTLIPAGLTQANLRLGCLSGGAWTTMPATAVGNRLQAQVSESLVGQSEGVASLAMAQAPIVEPVVIMPKSSPGLNDSYVYPDPALPGQDPVIRAELGMVDTVEVTIFDISGRAVYSGSMSGAAPSGIVNGMYFYDFPWTGSKVSGVYFAIVHGKAADGTLVRARVRFAVVR